MWLGWGNEIDRADRANKTDRTNKIGGANRSNKIGGAGTRIGMMGMGENEETTFGDRRESQFAAACGAGDN